jgi:hypothetical protein
MIPNRTGDGNHLRDVEKPSGSPDITQLKHRLALDTANPIDGLAALAAHAAALQKINQLIHQLINRGALPAEVSSRAERIIKARLHPIAADLGELAQLGIRNLRAGSAEATLEHDVKDVAAGICIHGKSLEAECDRCVTETISALRIVDSEGAA